MKKLFHAALVLPLVLFAVSCSESNDDGGNGGNGGNEGGGNTPTNIELTGGTSTQQQVYADQTETPAPIRFTAKAAWTATVTDTTPVQTKTETGKVDWLDLSAYSGGAGDVSLTMTLEENTTGQDRKAEIRIECAGTTIVITVEQKGTKQDGTTPEPTPTGYALVESVNARFWVGCEEEANSNDYSSSFHYVFHYDDQNRIAEYELSDYDYDGNGSDLDYKYNTRFDYSNPGEILLTETTTYDANNSQDQPRTETYRIQLDNQGRATQIKADGGDKEDITYFAYNDEGRLSRVSWYEYSGTSELSYNDMTYQNGVYSKVLIHEPHSNDEEIVFPADAFSDRLNDRLNIDPNWLVFTDPTEPQELLPMLRLTGKGCDRLTLWLPIDYEEDNIPPSEELPLGYPNPGEKKHETIVYYEHHKTEPLKYTFNDDGTIASIVQPVVHIKMQYDCDIVVGNELNDPFGYKYTILNETTRKLQESTDKHEWTFTYRK